MRLGDRPTWVSSSATVSRRSRRVRAEPEDLERLGDDVGDAAARAQRAVWDPGRSSAPCGACARISRCRQRVMSVRRRGRCPRWLDQPQQQRGRASTCRSRIRRPGRASRRAATSKRHAVDGAHVARFAPKPRRQPAREHLARALDADQRLSVTGAAPRRVQAATQRSRHPACRMVRRTGTGGGISLAHRLDRAARSASANGAAADRGPRRAATVPGIWYSRVAVVLRARGIDLQQALACRDGCGRAKDRADVAVLDDAARIHHDHALADIAR